MSKLDRRQLLTGAAAIVGLGLSSGSPLAAGGTAAAGGKADRRRDAPLQWWKGNTHMHTLWSDGDDFPEIVVAWYKDHGYHFLALSEHDRPPEGQWWKPVGVPPNPADAWQWVDERIVARYRSRWGRDWVEERPDLTAEHWAELERRFPPNSLQADRDKAQRWVRLKPLSEFRCFFEEPQRFLLMPSQEINGGVSPEAPDRFYCPCMTIADTLGPVAPGRGSTPLACLQAMLENIAADGRATGRHLLPVLNHPNYEWACTAEDIAQADGLRFMEIYTGLSFTNSAGDARRASAERIWDIVLTKRLAELNKPLIYGIASDDCHTYVALPGMRSWGQPGKGWIVVRSRLLTPESLFHAMERGDFYASTGVALEDLRVAPEGISVAIRPESGVGYRIQFIGTLAGYDPSSEPVLDPDGKPLRTSRRYSPEIGRVLAETSGTQASYRFRGDEIYVRARVISSKRHWAPLTEGQMEIAVRFGLPVPIGENSDPIARGEFEVAWTQPVVPG